MSYEQDFFSARLIKEVTVQVPLEMNDESPGYKTITEDNIKDAINFDLKSILLTQKGERFDKSFGVGLRAYLFENYNTLGTTQIRDEIRTQIFRYMPWISNARITVSENETLHKLSVNIKYKINNPQIVGHFNLSVSASDL